MRTLAASSLLLLFLPCAVSAQEPPDPDLAPRAFVAVYGIGQGATSRTTSTLEFSAYDEAGTAEYSQKYGLGAGFWIEGAFRFRPDLLAGIAFSQSSVGSTGTVTMSVPHPLLYNAPRSGSHSIDGAKQRVRGVHLWAGWRLLSAGRVDMHVQGGPSILMVRRDVATGPAAFSESGDQFTAVDVANPTSVRRSKSTAGVNIGATVGIRLTRSLDATGTLRYVYARPSIAGAVGSSKATVGGATFGGGLRLNF